MSSEHKPLTEWNPVKLDPGWLESRMALQNRYTEVSELIDASRFAYLRGRSESWTETEVANLWRDALANPISPTDSHNNAYIHVPFCKSICTFCNYERLRPSTTELLEQYIQRMETTLETFAPAVSPLTFHSLYIGGGTPSILPPKLLDRMLTMVGNALSFHPRAGKHFEFDPAVMSNEKTEVLRRHGFEHFSFGIQTLSADVNDAHNRGPQDIEMVGKRFRSFYENGLYDVSCDILLGLEGTSAQGILDEIETILTEYQPRRIDVFSLTPTHKYVDRHFNGSFEAFWEHLRPFEELVVPALPKLAEKTGYEWFEGGGHHMMLERGPSITKPKMFTKSQFSYNALAVETKRPIHILGLGRSARSQIFGYAAFQARDPEGEGADPEGPAEYVGHRIDREIEVRTYLAHYLRDTNKIDRAVFRRIFGVDITDALPLALAAWDKEGLLKGVTDKEVRLNEQERTERTRSLVWIVPDPYLEHEVARRERLDLSPSSLEGLLDPLVPGSRLGEYFTVEPADQAHIVLRNTSSNEEIRLRVAPELRPDRGSVRLILESTPPTDPAHLSALTKVVSKLKKLMDLRQQEVVSRPRDSKDRDRERAPAYSTDITDN